MEVHGDVSAPCPSLRYVNGVYRCELVEKEAILGIKPLIAQALGIGKGCCSSDLD